MFNNMIVSVTDPNDAIIALCSSGQVGSRGSRRSTPYAVQLATENAAHTIIEHGTKKTDVFIEGPGSGRETAIRSLTMSGLKVASISDVTL